MKLLTMFLLPLALCCPASGADWERWNSLMIEMARLTNRGDFQAATPLAIRAEEEARLAGVGEGRLADTLDALGLIHCQTGAYRLSEKAFIEAIAIAKPLPEYQARLAFALDHLAFLYREVGGRTAEVESLRRQALDIAVASLGPDAPEVGVLLSRLATSLMDRRKYNDAEVRFKRALELTSEYRFPGLAADMYSGLGTVAYRKGKYSDALELFVHAGQLYRQAAGPSSKGLVLHLTSLGALYLKMNRIADADQALEQAEQIASRLYGPEHLRVVEILYFRMESLRKLGKRKEAGQVRDRAQAIVAARSNEVSAVNSRVNAALTFKD